MRQKLRVVLVVVVAALIVPSIVLARWVPKDSKEKKKQQDILQKVLGGGVLGELRDGIPIIERLQTRRYL